MEEKIQLLKGDITKTKADAIVNAANSSLMGGGGVDGAIHRAGGPKILEECRKIIARIGSCKPGQAFATTAGNLPAKIVIHTVGPIWRNGNNGEKKTLAECYHNSLALAAAHNCSTIAFPNISTGVYGFPKAEAANVSLQAIRKYLLEFDLPKLVFLVCFDEENYHYIRNLLLKSQ